MKTILVVYSNDKSLTIEKVNVAKTKKYCFNTESPVEVGMRISSPSYSTPMLITDVLEETFNFFNSTTGELTKTVNATSCYPIRTIRIEDSTSDIVASVAE